MPTSRAGLRHFQQSPKQIKPLFVPFQADAPVLFFRNQPPFTVTGYIPGFLPKCYAVRMATLAASPVFPKAFASRKIQPAACFRMANPTHRKHRFVAEPIRTVARLLANRQPFFLYAGARRCHLTLAHYPLTHFLEASSKAQARELDLADFAIVSRLLTLLG